MIDKIGKMYTEESRVLEIQSKIFLEGVRETGKIVVGTGQYLN